MILSKHTINFSKTLNNLIFQSTAHDFITLPNCRIVKRTINLPLIASCVVCFTSADCKEGSPCAWCVCVCVCSTMQTDVKFIKLHFQLTEAPERSQKKSGRTVQKIQSLVRSFRFRLVNNKNAMLFRFHFGQSVAMAKHAKLCTSDEPASAWCA